MLHNTILLECVLFGFAQQFPEIAISSQLLLRA